MKKMYQEIKPSNRANNRIQSFWVFKRNNRNVEFKVFPDNCVDLIIDLNQNKGFISGIMTRYQNRILNENSNIIGIRFKAEDFPYLSEIPPSEIKNNRIEFSNLNLDWSSTMIQRLIEFKSLSDKIAYLERFLTIKQHKNDYSQDSLILPIINEIRKMKGRINITELSKSNLISIRQLERRFKKCIGITLKEFSNITRFQNAKKVISKSKQTSLLQIAFETGYYDHAHMNNDFKRISGKNPSSFR